MRLVLATSLAWAIALMCVGGIIIYGTTGFSPIVQTGELDGASAYTDVDHPDQERLRQALSHIHGRPEEKTLSVLGWVMNQIPVREDGPLLSSWEMIRNGRNGTGLLCAGMAQIFRDALLSIGIPARKVILKRSVFDITDTHATVEVWINGKWRIYDPTFHVAIRAGDERVGASEVREWILHGKGKPVAIEFLGEVAYPARIESYHIRYEAHFNNAFVELRRAYPRFLQPVVDAGVWLGARHIHAYERYSNLSYTDYAVYHVLWGTVVYALPLLSLVLAICLAILSRKVVR